MTLRRRLEAFEKDLGTSEPILLLMPDGRAETLPGQNDYVLNLLSRAVRGERTPEMELVARSVSSTEPGGAHMIDLLRALLNGPAETAPRRTRVPEYAFSTVAWKWLLKMSADSHRALYEDWVTNVIALKLSSPMRGSGKESRSG
jgi:hypothetical protein